MSDPGARALAYLGDAVYELRVRQHLISQGFTTADRLHTEAVRFTSAAGQARALAAIVEALSLEETAILKRGRNGGLSRKPRTEPLHVHHSASALEALFGYWFLAGDTARIEAVFAIIVAKLDGVQ
ncbi:MAG: ribonuclease III [Acholeplasmatales bacterium]|nr:MAG: ribonuclease III [Acholeplasmatales bacterium]